MLNFLIIGGGPAGLTFANMLKQKGENDFLLIEKENVAGGLCRSVDVDGSPLDIGGGHFLDVRRPEVNKFLFSFMPENEWNVFERDSRINIRGQLIHHPLEANIWEMDIESQISYLKSIASAGCNVGSPKPDRFTDWIRWKLGDKIADDYMLPYNRKMFGKNLDILGTYWLEKLPDVSFEDTLRSCLVHKAYAKQPGHARFYYPKKYGYGELWRRMSLVLGSNIRLGESVIDIDFDNRSIRTDKGEYQAQNIITTIPWKMYKELKGMPDSIKAQVDKLLHTSVCVEYFGENQDTTAHWVYYPDPELAYHRVLVRSNFCNNSKGYWTETNKDRVLSKGDGLFAYMNEYAYPLNTIEKKEAITEILDWCKTKRVYGLGRWGEHEHYNSDLTVELSMRLAEKIIK